MSVPRTSSCLSPSKSTRWTFDTAGVSGISGMRQAAARELERRLAGVGPGLRRGETFGCVAGEERQRLLHVGRQLHRAIDAARRADRRQPVFADEHHPHELVAPELTREEFPAEETRGTRRTRRAPAARSPPIDLGSGCRLIVGLRRRGSDDVDALG